MVIDLFYPCNIKNVRNSFVYKYLKEEFVIDKSGVKTVELIAPTFIADEDIIFGKRNEEYVAKELDWYLSKSLSIWDMPDPPKIWQQVCSKYGFINSNYGWCIFDDGNYNQFNNTLNELKSNKDSRRALMIYNRPSMWNDYNRDGMSDFMCTSNVHCLIRDNKLIYIVNQRSSDAIFGFNNDHFWHTYVYDLLFLRLNELYDLVKSPIVYQMGSLHIYERHFKFLKEYIDIHKGEFK